jgi:GMP synthase-like glutamine amidotransferase
MRVALIANASDADPGYVGFHLRRRGYSFVEYLREQHETWVGLQGISLVVALGSSWSTYWPEVAEATSAERNLMRQAIDRGIPILGICFGGQQLSTVLGGEVTRAENHEIGWCTIAQVGESQELCPNFLTSAPWMQWHYDKFSVPSGASVLADSPVGPQAMVAGRHLALQFHPEVTETMVRNWSSGEGAVELQNVGMRREDLLETTSANVEDAQERCGLLVDWFLDAIAQVN